MACYGFNIRTKNNSSYYFQINGNSRINAATNLVNHPDYINSNIHPGDIIETAVTVVVGNIVKPQGLIKHR
jgi:hypothetical protein